MSDIPRKPPTYDFGYRGDQQTFEECYESELERKNNSIKRGNGIQTYNGTVLDDGTVGEIVGQVTEEYKEGFKNFVIDRKSRLNDPEEVFNSICEYLEVCEKVSKQPDMIGLARKFGMTRANLTEYAKRHPGTATAYLIDSFRDACAEVIESAAKVGKVNPVFSIFLLKAKHDYRETAEVVVSKGDPLGEQQTPEQIAEKYSYLPEFDVGEDHVDVVDFVPHDVQEVEEIEI